MSAKAKHNVWAAGLALAAPLLFLAWPVAALFARAQGFLAVLFFVFWIYLPGRALGAALGAKVGRRFYHLVCFYLGCGGMFLLYYACSALGLMPVFRVLPPVAGICFALWQKRGETFKGLCRQGGQKVWALLAGWRAVAPLLWLVAIGVWVSYWQTSHAFPSLQHVSEPDFLWHAGNVQTLAHSPGFADLRVQGMVFRYHYFADLIWACGVHAVGLVPLNGVLRLPPLIVPLLMASAVYSLMQTVTKRRPLAFAAAACALFAAPLYGGYNDFTYQWASNVNAVGFAAPCCLAAIVVGRRVLLGGRVTPRKAAMIFVLAALTAGFKGPFGAVVLAALFGGALVAKLCKKPLAKRWGLVLLCSFAGFALIWVLLLRSGVNEDYFRQFELLYSVNTAVVLAPLLVALGEGVFARLVLLPVHMVIILGVFALPFMAACVRFLVRAVRRRPPDMRQLFYLAGAVASLFVFYLLNMAGRSQFYFMYIAVPLAGAVAVREVDAHLLPRLAKWRAGRWPLALAGVALAVFAFLHPMYIEGSVYYTATEVEAAYQLQRLVQPGEVIATNRHNVFYMATAVSGRQFFLEGDAYAKNSGVTQEMLATRMEAGNALFKQGTPDAAQKARQMGITWLIQYQSDADENLRGPVTETFDIVWQASDVTIYRVPPA